MKTLRFLRSATIFLFLIMTATASETVFRRAPNAGPAITGPTLTLTLTGVDSYVGVAANRDAGVTGSGPGDMFLRGNQKLLISMNGGSIAGLTVDGAGNVTATGSVTAPSFVGSIHFADGSVLTSASRKYYQTNTNFTGGQATTACASGFHMASIYEILNISLLTYDTTLGCTTEDSGSGPPATTGGWIRTGFIATDLTSGPGASNCLAWSSNSPNDSGSIATLPHHWDPTPGVAGSISTVAPFVGSTAPCSAPQAVWCVQN
jgi:hypothetical protein